MKRIFQNITCLWMAILCGIPLLLTGCVEKEITRIADWETHFTDVYFTDAKHGWISDITGGFSIRLTGARTGKNRR